MRQLMARPGLAVELIRKKLKPAVGLDAARIETLLRALDSGTLAVVEAASAELARLAERIEPRLRTARGTASAEMRTRLDRLLEGAAKPSPERLRQSRALGTLEFIATPEALRLLAELDAGPEGDRLTVE